MTLAFTIAALTLTSAALLAYIALGGLLISSAVLIFSIRSSRRSLRDLLELQKLLEEEDLLEPDASSN